MKRARYYVNEFSVTNCMISRPCDVTADNPLNTANIHAKAKTRCILFSLENALQGVEKSDIGGKLPRKSHEQLREQQKKSKSR